MNLLVHRLLAFLSLIMTLLPEDWQRIILDEQERLKQNNCSDSQLLIDNRNISFRCGLSLDWYS
ncbi:hypothetical protein MICAF_2470006 [Microcystis aeruginosa PCC 9807]|uniref:Uncharacterized protein n=1 Tax=Microcystis aeruginosa PCC 9807 TaxID=1160283 RepID=I4H4Y4_MICAE|nr:hypothetical protein MICAF_2470006 [Microcystis aeruginosa PCC 9807]